MNQYDGIVVSPELAISNRQGIDIFDNILRYGYADVIVSKKDPGALTGERSAGKPGDASRKTSFWRRYWRKYGSGCFPVKISGRKTIFFRLAVTPCLDCR